MKSFLIICVALGFFCCQKEMVLDDDLPNYDELVDPLWQWDPVEIGTLCADLEVKVDLSEFYTEQIVIVQICNIGAVPAYYPIFRFHLNVIGEPLLISRPFSVSDPGECQDLIFNVEGLDNVCGAEAWLEIPSGRFEPEELPSFDCNFDNNRDIELLPICEEIFIDYNG